MTTPQEASPNDIVVDKIVHTFSGTPVIKGATFTLKAGSLTGLIGPSGSGKSVLLKIAAGIYQPSEGAFRNLPARKSLMFQEGALFDSLNVLDNVAFPLVYGKVPTERLPHVEREQVRHQVLAMLDRVGLAWACTKMPAELSGGMRRRVSLARALVNNPELALLDDPTSGLDPVASSVIMNLIVELQKEYGSTMLVVSHDLRRLLPVCSSIIALWNGEVHFRGTLQELEQCSDEEVKAFVQCRFDLGTSPQQHLS